MAPRFSVVVLFVLFAALGTAARGQQLARLHVQSFTLTSDTAYPKVEEPFNVTLTIRVRENITGPLANVILPSLAGVEELGDERVLSSGPGGTVYRETLRLVAHSRGPLTIGSAYLDAIDARDGKPKRFISNDLHLQVQGGPLDVWGPLRAIFRTLIELVLLAAAIFVLVAIFRRRPAPAAQTPAPIPVPKPVTPPSPEDILRQRLAELRERRDRQSVLRVRAALWNATGAHDGETLADVLRRPIAHDPRTHSLLLRVERATFIEDARLPEAIDDVLAERESTIA